MAQTHASPGEVVDVRPLGGGLAAAKTEVLVRSEDLELIRLVLPAGKELPMHVAPGLLVVQCLEGRVAFTALGRTQDLPAGRLLYLPPREPHAVYAVEASSLLVTIFRRPQVESARDAGGA